MLEWAYDTGEFQYKGQKQNKIISYIQISVSFIDFKMHD